MYDQILLEHKIIKIFKESLNFVPPDVGTDLFMEGGLDSLMFVDLLAELEQTFCIEIPLEKLELDDFRSVLSIARFIANHGDSGKEEAGKVVPIKPALMAGGRNDR